MHGVVEMAMYSFGSFPNRGTLIAPPKYDNPYDIGTRKMVPLMLGKSHIGIRFRSSLGSRVQGLGSGMLG